MNGKNFTILMTLFFSFACYGITTDDVQKLNVNQFLREWPRFLDQVLQEQEEQVSSENSQIYQAFITQAKKLNIAKVTGNKKYIAGMREQMEGIQKRLSGKKKVLHDWEKLSEELSAATEPLSVENEKKYKALMRQAKDLGIEKNQLDEMKTKMNELRDKLGVAAQSESAIPSPVMSPVVVSKKKEAEVQKEEFAELLPVNSEKIVPVNEATAENQLEAKSAI